MHLVGDVATEHIAEYVPFALAALAPYAGRDLPDVMNLGTGCRLLTRSSAPTRSSTRRSSLSKHRASRQRFAKLGCSKRAQMVAKLFVY
jgi:hypothetical protein